MRGHPTGTKAWGWPGGDGLSGGGAQYSFQAPGFWVWKRNGSSYYGCCNNSTLYLCGLKEDSIEAHTTVTRAGLSMWLIPASLCRSRAHLKCPSLTCPVGMLAGSGDLSWVYRLEHMASPCGLGVLTAWWLGSVRWHLERGLSGSSIAFGDLASEVMLCLFGCNLFVEVVTQSQPGSRDGDIDPTSS